MNKLEDNNISLFVLLVVVVKGLVPEQSGYCALPRTQPTISSDYLQVAGSETLHTVGSILPIGWPRR